MSIGLPDTGSSLASWVVGEKCRACCAQAGNFWFLCGLLFLFSAHASVWADARPVLKVVTFFNPSIRAIAEEVHTFEADSSCWVQWDFRYAYDLEELFFSGEIDAYDVVMIDEPWVAGLSSRLLPVSEWPTVVDDSENTWSELTEWEGVSYGHLLRINYYMYVYRADVFNDESLRRKFEAVPGQRFQAPRELEQLLQLARFFDSETDFSGFAPVTRQSESMTVDLLWFLRMAGVRIDSVEDLKRLKKGRVAAALGAYQELVRLRPTGADDWFTEEINMGFIRNETPQMFQWSGLVEELSDPVYSRVGAGTGFLPLPSDKWRAKSSVTSGWVLAIPRGVKADRELCARFVNWLLERERIKDEMPGHNLAGFSDRDLLWSRPKMVYYREFSATLSGIALSLVRGDADPEIVAERLIEALAEFAEMEEGVGNE